MRKARLLALAGAALTRALVATLRVRVEDRAGILAQPETRLIGLFWHNRLFLLPHLFERYFFTRRPAALTSASKDGDLVAAFITRFGVRPIRGSSSRRGAAALLEMRSLLEQGYDLAITPDGPRGPRYALGPGAVVLAQKTGTPLLPVHLEYSRAWRFRSWDGFFLPKPFARAEVVLGPLLHVRATSTPEEFEAERQRVEAALMSGVKVA